MEFLLSVIRVRGGEWDMKNNSFKNFVYFTAWGEAVFALCDSGKSCSLGLSSTEWSGSLSFVQQWLWQVEGMTGSTKCAELWKVTPVVCPDLPTALKVVHVLFSLAHRWAFCQGSWGIFTLIFSLVYVKRRMVLSDVTVPKAPLQWRVWQSIVPFNRTSTAVSVPSVHSRGR